MNIEKLNEELKKLLNEVQTDNNDLLDQVLQHTYDLSGPTLAEIIIPNIDKVTVDELIDILNDFHGYINQDQSLLPSAYDENLGPYPVKLAEAVARFDDRELITDIYNVYYRSKGIQTFKEAMQVWKNAIKQNPQETINNLKVIGDVDDDAQNDALIFDAIKQNHLDLVNFLLQELNKNDVILADKIEHMMEV